MNVGDRVKLVGTIKRRWEGPFGAVFEVHFDGANGPQQVRENRLVLDDNPLDYQEDLL